MVFIKTAYILSLLIVIYTDLKYGIIPDYITIPLIALFLILSIINKNPLSGMALDILLSGGLFFISGFIAEKAIHRPAIGGGDIKLITAIGLYKHWHNALFIILIGSLSALICAVILSFFKKQKLSAKIPFGIYLGISGILYELILSNRV